ncbi:unnamed protein product [Rhizophagus irregularis]|nr:unnamed protein product [Rhizophagus irregularis]
MQFEDFAEELKEVENLSENLVRKVNSFTVKSEEIEQLAEELNKIRVLTKKLKEVKKFAEEVSIFVDKRKLGDILIKGELKNIKNFADKLNSRVKDEKDDDTEDDDDIEEVENEERNNNENEEKIKKWSFLNIINGIKEKRSHSIKQKKGYQKFSKCAIVGDISLIILQSFYVTRVVSLGYTPVYNISKSSIDFFSKGFLIIKHMLTARYI